MKNQIQSPPYTWIGIAPTAPPSPQGLPDGGYVEYYPFGSAPTQKRPVPLGAWIFGGSAAFTAIAILFATLPSGSQVKDLQEQNQQQQQLIAQQQEQIAQLSVTANDLAYKVSGVEGCLTQYLGKPAATATPPQPSQPPTQSGQSLFPNATTAANP